MTYTAKTNWTAADGVSAADLNRIEQGVANALESASYTAADVLTKIKTVDGSGSGLDADTVKGYTPANKAGDTFTGSVGFPSNGGNFQLIGGTGDGASYTTYNTKIHGHWGIAIETYDGTIFGYYDTRIGKWDVKDGYYVDGVKMPQTRNNSGTLEFNDSGTWKAVGGVKNVQRGVASGPNDGSSSTYNVTISTVNLSKSFLTFSAVFPSGSTAAGVRVRLTSSTNIEVYSNGNNGAIVAYEVVESY